MARLLFRPLTPRELAVVRLVAAGLTYRVIAERLAISKRTVGMHVVNAASKMVEAGASPSTLPAKQAVFVFCVRNGLDHGLGV